MLVTRVGRITCAFPIAQVVEIMRPLPVEPLVRPGLDALALVDGVAMVRGEPVPVVDARRLLGATGGPDTRFVIVRAADHRVAVVVDAVFDVRRIEHEALLALPPLLRDAHRDSVAALGASESGLLVVLDAARVLPEDTWQALAHRGEVPGPGDRSA